MFMAKTLLCLSTIWSQKIVWVSLCDLMFCPGHQAQSIEWNLVLVNIKNKWVGIYFYLLLYQLKD